MGSESTREIRLVDFDKKSATSGKVRIRHYTLVERLTRAVTYFGVFLLLAVGSVFIPILHFVLVPLFSIAAVGSAAAYFLQKDAVAQANGTCPYCQATTELKRALVDKEFTDSCEHCLQLIHGTLEGPK